MTIDISDNNPRISYTVASGVTQTSFAVPFEFFDDSDVKVYLNNVLQTITTNYTISGGDGSTGTVTMSVTGPATVVLVREITIERVTDFPTGIDINRAALNTQLDSLTAICADIESKVKRAFRFDLLEAEFDPLPFEGRENKYLAFDTNGLPVFVSGTSSDIVVSTFVETLLPSSNASAFLSGLGINATVTEINYSTGLTGGIQSQLDALSSGKQNLDATLTAYASTLTAANKIPYATSIDVAGELDFKDEDDMASNSATAVPSQQSVKAYVDSEVAGIPSSIGYGQTWQDVKASRANNTQYQNTTGKPIMVFVTGGSVSGTTFITAYAGTASANLIVGRNDSRYGFPSVSFIVPDQHYYKVSAGAGIQYWTELR